MDDTCGGFLYTLSSQTAVRSTMAESPAAVAGQGALQQAGPDPLQPFEHAELPSHRVSVPMAEFRFASAVLAAEGRMVVTTASAAGEESSPLLELRLLTPSGQRPHQPSACPGHARSPRASVAEHHHGAHETPAVPPPNLAASSVGRHAPTVAAAAASCAFDEEGGLIFTSTQVELTARDAPQDHDDGDDGEEQEEPGAQQHAANQTMGGTMLEFTAMDSGIDAIDPLVALTGVEQAGRARREGGGDYDRTMVEGTLLDAGGTLVDMSVIGAGSAADRSPHMREVVYTSTTLAQLAECRSATGAEDGAGPAEEVHLDHEQDGGRVERTNTSPLECGPAACVARGVEDGDGGAAMVAGEAAPAADERDEHRPLADEETHSIKDSTAQLVHGMDMDGQCSLVHKETSQSEALVGMSRVARESPPQDAGNWSHTAVNTAHDARAEDEPVRDGNREPSPDEDSMRLADGAEKAHPLPREDEEADHDRVAAAIGDGAAVHSESVPATVGTRDVALDAGRCTVNGASDVECGSAQAGPIAPQQEASCLSVGSPSVAEGERTAESGQYSSGPPAPSDTTAQRGHCASEQEGQRLSINESDQHDDEICLALPGGWRSGATQSQASQLDRMPSQASTCGEAIELAFPEVSRNGGATQQSSLGSQRVGDGTQWTQQSSQYIELRLPSLTPAGSSPRAANSVADDGRQDEVGEGVEGQERSASSRDSEAAQQPYTPLSHTANGGVSQMHVDGSGDGHSEGNAERPARKPEKSQQASGGQERLVASAQGTAIAATSAQEKPGDDDAQKSEIAVEPELTVKVQREVPEEAASGGGHSRQHASAQQLLFPQPSQSQRSSLPEARPVGSDGSSPDGSSHRGSRESVNLRLLSPPASACGDAPHGPTAAASVHASPSASPAVSQHEDVSLRLGSEKMSPGQGHQESRISEQLSSQPDSVSLIQLGLPEGSPLERRAESRRVDGEQPASEALVRRLVKHDCEHDRSSRSSSLASPDGHAVEVEQADGVEEEKDDNPESGAAAERRQEAGQRQTDRSPGDKLAVPMEVEADKGQGMRGKDLEPSAPQVVPTPTPASAQRRRKDDNETAATLENSENAFPSGSKATPLRLPQAEDEQSSAEIHARTLFNLRYTPAPPSHDDTPVAPRAPRRSSPPAPGSYWEAAGHKDSAYAPTPPPISSAADNPAKTPSESPRSSPPPHEARRSRTEDVSEEISPCLLSSQVDDHDIPLTSASPRASSVQRSSQSSSPVSASVRRASEAETERDLAAEADEFFRDDDGGSEASKASGNHKENKPTSKEPTPINALPATDWLGRRTAPVLPADARESLGSSAADVGACGDHKTDRSTARAGGNEASKRLTSDKRGKASAVTGPVDNDGPKHKKAGGNTDADAAPGVATTGAAKSDNPPQQSDAALVLAAAAAKSKKQSSSVSEGDGRCLEEWESTQQRKRAEKRRPFVEAPPSSSSPVQENEAKLATLPSRAAPRAVGADEQQGLGQQLLERALAALARELEEKERHLNEREAAKTQEYEAKERDLAEKERRLKEWEARLQALTRQQGSVPFLPAPPITGAPALPATEPASRKAASVGSSAMRGRGPPTSTTKSPSKLQTASASVKSPTKSTGERHNLRSPLRSDSPTSKRKQQQQEQQQEQQQPSARRGLNTGPLASGARPCTAGAPPYDDVLDDVFAFPESIEAMPRIRCQADASGRKLQQGQTSGQVTRHKTHSLFSPKQARGSEGRPMGAAVTARAQDVNGLKLAATGDKKRKRVAQESDEDEDGGAVVSPQAQKLRTASPVHSPRRRQSTGTGAAAKHAVMLTRVDEGLPKQRQKDARVQHPQRQRHGQRPEGVKLKIGKPQLKVKTKTRGHDKPTPSIEFNELWPYLNKELNWKWTKGRGHVSYYYLRPGMTVKTGRPGQDYFTSEEDVIKYCVDNDLLPEPEEDDDALGEICDEQGLTMEDPMARDGDPRQPTAGHSDEEEEERGQQETRHGRKSVSFERQKRAADAYDSGNDNFDFANDHVMFGHDEHVSDTDEPPRKMLSSSSGRRRTSRPPSPHTAALPSPTKGRSVEEDSGVEDFRSLWRRLVKDGWKYKKGGRMGEPYYVRPGKNRKDGVKDQDWFESASGVQDWYERNVLGRTYDDDGDLNMDQEGCGDDGHVGRTGRSVVDHCRRGSKHVLHGSEGKRKARDYGDHDDRSQHGAAAKKPCTVDSVSKRPSSAPVGREKSGDKRVGSLRGVDLEEPEHGDESQQLTQPQFDMFLHMTDAAGAAQHRGAYKAPALPSAGRVASGKKAAGDLVTPSHQPRAGQGHSNSSKKRQSTGGSTSIHITNRSTRGSIFQGLQFLVTGLTPKSTPTRSYIESRIRMHGGLIMHALEDVKLPSGAADFLSPDIDGEEEDNATLRDVVLVSIPGALRRPKYVWALAVGVPIVYPAWVDHCIQSHTTEKVNTITADSFPEFRLPLGFSFKHDKFMFQPDCLNGRPFDGMSVLLCCQNDTLAKDWVSIFKTAGAYAACLQAVDDSWLEQQSVDFVVADPQWPTSATTTSATKLHAVLRANGDAKLRSVDWAIQCFLHGELLEAKVSPRYFELDWRMEGGDVETRTVVVRDAQSNERYDVGDFVFVLAESGASSSAKASGGGRGSMGGGAGLEEKKLFGRVEGVSVAPGRSAVLDVRLLAPTGQHRELTASLSGVAGSRPSNVRVKVERLCGKFILLESEDYRRHAIYASRCDSIYRKAKGFDWDSD